MSMSIFRISCAFTYYALSFGVSQLPGNLFLNNFIMCAVEMLGYVVCYSIAWLGRKGPTVGTYLGGALSLLISILLLVFQPGQYSKTYQTRGYFCLTL